MLSVFQMLFKKVITPLANVKSLPAPSCKVVPLTVTVKPDELAFVLANVKVLLAAPSEPEQSLPALSSSLAFCALVLADVFTILF